MHWLKRLGQQLSNTFTSLTLTRWHTAFFVVTFLHCAGLVFLQSVSFTINEEARDFMVHLRTMTGAGRDGLAIVVTRPQHTLFLCHKVPGDGLSYRMSVEDIEATGACTQVSPILDVTAPTSAIDVDSTPNPNAFSVRPSSHDSQYQHLQRRNILYPAVKLVPDIEDGQLVGLSVVGLDNSSGIVDPNGNLWISDTCVAALRYPEQEFTDAGRENVSFLFFHVWVLAISILAIVNESISHLASALAGQCLATAYASWDIFRTLRFRHRYEELIADTLCSGAQLIPNYWGTRNRLNVSIACVNLGALSLTFWITVVLIRMFLTSQFKSVGAAPILDKLYRLLMTFSTTMRLWMFFLVLSTVLWMDQVDGGLLHTFISRPQCRAYMGICVFALILVLPVVFAGDIAMRQERRALAVFFLAGQTLLFAYQIYLVASTPVYRWTLIIWPFFAVNVAAGFFLCVCTFTLGIVCRLQFGRGLDHFLHVTNVLERDGFTRAFMSPERSPTKKSHTPAASLDRLLESGETVKVDAQYLQPDSSRSGGKSGGGVKKKRAQRRDSTESFGQTTFDPRSFDEKVSDSVPVFDNRDVVRVPDGADRI